MKRIDGAFEDWLSRCMLSMMRRKILPGDVSADNVHFRVNPYFLSKYLHRARYLGWTTVEAKSHLVTEYIAYKRGWRKLNAERS